MREMLEQAKKNWIISAVLCIAIGILLFLFPEPTLVVLCYVVGGIAVVAGVVRMVRNLKQDHTYPVIFQNEQIFGLFTVGTGLFLLFAPRTVMGILPFLFAVVLAGFGIANILRALDAKQAGIAQWAVLLALSILTVILGGVVLFNPFKILTVAVKIAGTGLMYEGVSDIATVLLVGKRIQAWRDAQ